MTEKGRLYFGGEIHTVDDVAPFVEAVAVKNGRIIAVGSESECKSMLGDTYESIDLKGKALLPGFIDTHLHPPLMLFYELSADLRDITTIEQLQTKMRAVAQKDKSANWVVGIEFEEKELSEPKIPTRHDLDAACPDRPAFILMRDGHSLVANTKAIQIVGLTASTCDPEGGLIVREDDGYPAGHFCETASQLILEGMPFPDMETISNTIEIIGNQISANGITSAGVILQTDEEGVAGKQGIYDVPLMEMFIDKIQTNMYVLLVAHDLSPFTNAYKTKLHTPEKMGENRVGGLKFWADGTFGSWTAYLSSPYTDQPEKSGLLIHDEDEMYRRMVLAHNAGLQIAIHVIGDAACRVCVDLFERLLTKYPKANHRHRLEHVSLLSEDLIADISRLNLVVCVNPSFIHEEKSWLPVRLGLERVKWVYPFRALIDAGIKVAAASDAPASSLSALDAIQRCVTREGFEPHQGISAPEAIRMYTIDAAYAQFEESVKGSISVGKRADFVILSKNPATVPTEEIKKIVVEQTISGGEEIYSRNTMKYP
ncbi:amidohydrolase [bacterium]|nr:amidohydrolase [bacterium]